MTGVFKNNNPAILVITFFYGLLLKLSFLLHPSLPQPQIIDGFLYKKILLWISFLGINNGIIFSILTYLLLFTQAISINWFVNSQKLLQKPTYLTAMTYLLFTSFFSEWNMFSSALIINTLVIHILIQISKLNESKSVNATLLNIGILTGLGTFIYFPSIAFCLLIIIGVVLTRRFNIKEWLMVLIGVATPYYFLLAYVFLTDQWKGYHFPGFAVQLPHLVKSGWVYTGIGIITFCFLLGMYLVQKNFMRLLIQTRKSWNLIYFYLLISVAVPFLNTSKSFSYWILVAVPLSIIAAACFIFPKKNWIPNLLHWLMVAFIVAQLAIK